MSPAPLFWTTFGGSWTTWYFISCRRPGTKIYICMDSNDSKIYFDIYAPSHFLFVSLYRHWTTDPRLRQRKVFLKQGPPMSSNWSFLVLTVLSTSTWHCYTTIQCLSVRAVPTCHCYTTIQCLSVPAGFDRVPASDHQGGQTPVYIWECDRLPGPLYGRHEDTGRFSLRHCGQERPSSGRSTFLS